MDNAGLARQVLRDVDALVMSMLPEIVSFRSEVTWKPDDSPVTSADILLEGRIREFLFERLPDLLLVGEESYEDGSDDAHQGWIAVLDPIDGTENFCSGLKEWGVSLSLWHARTHQASMLLLPDLDERLVSGDPLERQTSRIVGLSSSLTSSMIGSLQIEGEMRMIGCAVYNLFNVIRGSFARFVNPKGARSWDISAGLMLALEHRRKVLVDGAVYDGQYLSASRRYRFDILD